MTEDEIEFREDQISDYNNEQEKEARAKFNKGPVPKLKWVMERLLDCLIGCIAAVKSGKAPDGQLGDYMSDELARIIATQTFLSYGGLSLDENAAKEAGPNTCFEDVLNSCTIFSWTQEFGQWRKIFTAVDARQQRIRIEDREGGVDHLEHGVHAGGHVRVIRTHVGDVVNRA